MGIHGSIEIPINGRSYRLKERQMGLSTPAEAALGAPSDRRSLIGAQTASPDAV